MKLPDELPEGYRQLTEDEDVIVGDLAWNVVGECWQPVNELTLIAAHYFRGRAKDAFRFCPIRKDLNAG